MSVQTHKRMGPEVDVRHLPYHSLTLSIEPDSLTESESHQFSRMSDQLQDLPDSVSTALGLQRCRPGYYMGAGIQIQAPLLVQRALC